MAEAVARLKREGEGEVHVIGSAQLVHMLIAHKLVDEFRLMIDPVLLGGGKRLFPDDGRMRALRLLERHVTSTGAILARYAAAEG